MWWGVTSDTESLRIQDRKVSSTRSKSFHVPTLSLDALEEQLNIGTVEDDIAIEPACLPHIFKKKTPEVTSSLPALPAPSHKSWVVDTTVCSPRKSPPSYWSVESKFWDNWMSEENERRDKALDAAKLDFQKREKSIADAAKAESDRRQAEDDARLAKEKAKKDEEAVAVSAVAEVKSPCTNSDTSTRISGLQLGDRYNTIMEEGKQYRSEFISIWRDISLGVSTTAANSRSVELNSSKLVSSLSRGVSMAGPSRAGVATWLSAVCGSRIVNQATSGNKTLVWSFAYLARVISDTFPDVVKVGILGETINTGGYSLHGSSLQLPMKAESAKEFEQVVRFWVALLCVFNDEVTLWGWVASAVNDLNKRKAFLSSWEAQWNLMKIYIWMEVGLFDFRRLFGSQAVAITSILEGVVFPKIDAELQAVQQSTSVSVQFRFYLDSCYNILQSRKYMEPPDGYILSVAKESELNPDL